MTSSPGSASCRRGKASLRWRRDSIDHAVNLLENGLASVGDNAALYAAPGRVHLQYREAGLDPGDAPLHQAARCVEKTRALDRDAVASHQLQGWLHYAHGQVADAVRELRKALTSDWSNADTLGLISNCYLISGKVDAARPFIECLLAVDPLTPLNRCLPGWAAALQGDFEAAIAPYRSMYVMDPGNPMAGLFYSWILALNGRTEEVHDVLDAFPAATADAPPAIIARLYADALDQPASLSAATLPEAVTQLAATSDIFPRFLAEAFAIAGIDDAAIDWLTAAVNRGFINYPYLSKHHPFFARLADRPRMATLLGQVHQQWTAFPE